MAKGASTFNVSIKLLTDNFNKGLKGIQKQLRGFGNFVKGAFALGSITAFGRQIVQVTSEFEDSMARVKAVSNASADGFKMMADEARRLGATTKYTATEAANALENLTRNGMSATNATQALSGTLQLAQANAIGLAEAADIVSNTLNMFGMSAQETGKVNDILSATASHSATNISLLYEALVNAAPASKALGVGLEETAAAIGALAQKGVKGADAGTALRIALTKMINPKNVAKMQELGISIDENTIKTEGLIGAVKKLREANLSGTDAIAIFSERGAMLMQQLIGAYEDFDLMLEITKSSAGTTARMFKQGVGTTKKAIDTLKSTYESFLITIGNKTSSVVNGAINFLTKLIKNFETVEGTIANLASVVVPLFTKRVVTMFTVFSTGAKKAAADALTLKMAMGDWITLIATAATWLATGLIANVSKLNKEIKENNKQISDLNTKTEVLKGRVNNLVDNLGPKTDATTLAGVVKELTSLFPDFTKEIMNAASEAAKTGNYEKLRNLLNDIVTLQHTISATSLVQGAIQMNAEKGAQRIMNATRYTERRVGNSEIPVSTSEFEQEMVDFREAVENGLKARNYSGQALRDETKELLTYAVSEMQKNYSIEETARNIQGIFKTFGIEVSDILIKSLTLGMQQTAEGVAGFEANKDLRAIQQANEVAAQRTAKAQQDAATAAERDAKNKEDAANRSKRIADIEKDYNSSILEAEDDYKLAGESAAALREKLIKLGEAAEKAYDAYRKETGKTGESNPYYSKMIEAGKNQRNATVEVNGEKVELYPKVLSGGSSASGPTQVKTPKEKPIPGGQAHPVIYNEDFYDYIGYVDDAIMVTDSFANSLSTLASSFKVLSEEDSTWIERLAASTRILQTMASSVFEVIGMINKLGDIEQLAAKKEAVISALNLRRKKKEILANSAAAASAGAESQAGIPIVGPILAIAAVATILGLMATLPKFAKGGIFTGGSHHGDRMLARVNSGEMILNNRQQKELFDIANGKSAGIQPGYVEFIISGQNLKGVLRNIDSANSRIAGAKGM